MLAFPKYGWSEITIGDWSDRCSYLDDVPFLLLEGMEESIRTGNPVASKFDAEGYEYIVVFDKYETHIIRETEDGYALKTVDIILEKLAKELVQDIRNSIAEWSGWLDYGDMTNEEKQKRSKDLFKLCSIIEKQLEE